MKVIITLDPSTRVVLFLKFGVANSDFINANFIRVSEQSMLLGLCTNHRATEVKQKLT